MIIPHTENAPAAGVVLTGTDTFPLLLVSLSSLEDSSELDASDETFAMSGIFFASEGVGGQ